MLNIPSLEGKSWILYTFLLAITGCADPNANPLSSEICDCLDKQEATYPTATLESKKAIVQECFQSKIIAAAQVKNEAHLKENEKSKLLEFITTISAATTQQLNQNCSFFKTHKQEVTELLKEAAAGDKVVKPKKPTQFQGEIIAIETLENNSNNITIKLDNGKTKIFFYQQIPESHIGKRVEFAFEPKILDGTIVNWIKTLKLL